MVITFYKCLDDHRKINKTLGTSTGSMTGHLHERVSDLDVTVKLPYAAYSILQGSNYCHIDTFSRYYYIVKYEIENDCVIATMHEDVLKSNAAALLNVNCTITRNQNMKDGYLADDGYKVKAYKNIVTREFGNSMDDYSIIVMTVG